ncbi:MAG: membrane protein insertion efficiency factor YidD [Holosporaceae bacterium]|jgi:putative membrane protein insertion efficiency factor|nr:membrane protein insertion efficiency factor YidD [Holosporaceae bacterium]
MQWCIFFLITAYQRYVSRFLKAQCKFYPTCSEYALQALQKYGILKGGLKILFRLLRCSPFSYRGVDFP